MKVAVALKGQATAVGVAVLGGEVCPAARRGGGEGRVAVRLLAWLTGLGAARSSARGYSARDARRGAR